MVAVRKKIHIVYSDFHANVIVHKKCYVVLQDVHSILEYMLVKWFIFVTEFFTLSEGSVLWFSLGQCQHGITNDDVFQPEDNNGLYYLKI